MSEEQWKLEQDLCRCCLNEGSFKNLAEPCLNQGEEEIYSEMLLESLDINITPVSGPLCNSTYTICEECVLRLRDACSFKRQVLLSEKRFRELYRRDVIKLHSTSLDVKQEVPDSDNEDGDPVKMEMDQNEDDDDFRISYEHDDADSKSNIEIEIQEEKKTKPRKPKAKEKPKPKKKAGRPRKVKAEADAEADDDTKDKKEHPPIKGCSVIEEDGKLRYMCNQCKAVLKTRYTIRDHILLIHNKSATHPCPLCGEVFKKKGTMTRHLALTHSMREYQRKGQTLLRPTTIYICDVCNKEFLHRAKMVSHARSHLRVRCPDCAEQFNYNDLIYHRAEAHNVAMPTCGVCGYRSPRQCVVDAHQRKVHLRERTTPCPHCDLKFFSAGTLARHMVRHNPVKSFECNYCSKKFPRKSTLHLHVRIHTGDKQKVCPICDERFVQKASLNYHLTKRHPEAC